MYKILHKMHLSRNWFCAILFSAIIILYIGNHVLFTNCKILPLGFKKYKNLNKALTKEHYQSEFLSDKTLADSSEYFSMPDPVTFYQIKEITTKSHHHPSSDERLRSIIKCHDRDYKPEILQRGDYWILKNYISADHGEIECYSTITYTTHGDYSYLDNVIPLLRRWMAPISIALYAPGTDFTSTLDSIIYLRNCLPDSKLVRMFTTFHIYFISQHRPKFIPKYKDVLERAYSCMRPPPYANINSSQLYKAQKMLLYPVNVGRNVARDAALTHFILASDIELYPSMGLVQQFLDMITRNETYLQRKAPRVFPLSIFEIAKGTPEPQNKTQLQFYLRNRKAKPFHWSICSTCHTIPNAKKWRTDNETDHLSVFHIGKRLGEFRYWEPIYIGTHAEPHYDERLSWEGKRDKMTQGYALCVLDYEFHILDNAFLIHKSGFKFEHKDKKRKLLIGKTNELIAKMIYPELKLMYGTRKGCIL